MRKTKESGLVKNGEGYFLFLPFVLFLERRTGHLRHRVSSLLCAYGFGEAANPVVSPLPTKFCAKSSFKQALPRSFLA